MYLPVILYFDGVEHVPNTYLKYFNMDWIHMLHACVFFCVSAVLSLDPQALRCLCRCVYTSCFFLSLEIAV